MTEKELIALGFKKMVEESHPSFYYFTLKICESLSFITCADDEVINGKWWAELYDSPSIRFNDHNQLKQLIDLLNQNKDE
tara:strand:- start:1233 stop:1472 length:240 start_codon:yes stop_codon:yes gene_type:complete